MRIASVAHMPLFLDDQRRAFARYAPDATYTVVSPKGWHKAMADHCGARGVQCKASPHSGYLPTVQWLASTASEPTVIVEWDVVPLKPVRFEAACSYRGRQHPAVPASTRRFYYPNVLALDPRKDRYQPGGGVPFARPFRKLEHYAISGHLVGLPDCCEPEGFSMIGDEFVHHLHGHHQTPSRCMCWHEVMNTVCPSGLGDYVAAGLSAVGITPERVSAVTGKQCGCKQRQEALNALGRRLGIGGRYRD